MSLVMVVQALVGASPGQTRGVAGVTVERIPSYEIWMFS